MLLVCVCGGQCRQNVRQERQPDGNLVRRMAIILRVKRFLGPDLVCREDSMDRAWFFELFPAC